jgi:preprotein translocase subunit SecD
MNTLAETLRAADPLAYESPRSVQRRRVSRQVILSAPRVPEDVPRRPIALATIVALAISWIALSSLYWSRTAVNAVAAVRFEVRLAEERPAAGLREAAVVGTDLKIYLHGEPVVANSDIIQARVVEGNSPSTFGVSVTFSVEGGAKLLRATQGHIGRPLAILVDGEVIAAPVVRSPTGTSAVISGDYTKAEAERIVGGILGR